MIVFKKRDKNEKTFLLKDKKALIFISENYFPNGILYPIPTPIAPALYF